MSSESPLRILFAGDIGIPSINGVSAFVFRLAAGLASRGHDVHIVGPSSDAQPGTSQEQHYGATVTTHRLPTVSWPFMTEMNIVVPWRVQGLVSEVMDSVKPDVVHVQTSLPIGTAFTHEAVKRKTRVVATNHVVLENFEGVLPFSSITVPLVGGWLWGKIKATYGLADVITAPTPVAAQEFKDSTGLDKHVESISCGTDLSGFKPHLERPTVNEILYVGRIAPEKRLDVLVKAMQHLPPALNARLTVIGKGDYLSTLRTLATSLHLEDKVTFTGRVSEEEKISALSRASVFAMPSTAELQSISGLEAIASGLPLVAANAVALPHLVDGNGYLFEPGNEKDLADKLNAVLAAPDTNYLDMRKRSREIGEKHDISLTVDAYEAVYRGRDIST